MRHGISKLAFLAFFLSLSFSASAQTSGSSYLSTAMIAIVALIALGAVLMLADSFLQIEAKNMGADKDGANFSLFPSRGELFKPKVPAYTNGDQVTVLKKGHDILLAGEAAKNMDATTLATTFAIKPANFIGMSPIPKVEVEEGAEVKAGDILLFDKKRPDVKYVSPVSGEVVAVNRGEKRSIAEVVILADKGEMKYRSYPSFDLANGSRADLVAFLLESGAWPFIRQRPFDVVADPKDTPKNIFITTFDTAPLAPDLNFVVEGRGVAFQKGLDVLNKLTEGTVHLGLNAGGENKPSAVFTEATGVQKNWFRGPHPAGNVGVQIHHTDPIGSNEKVWVLGVQDVITLGALFTEGRFNAERVVALAGAELKNPRYIKTYLGANLENLMKEEVKGDNVRVVSGDVLSGTTVPANSFLNFYDDQITVLTEGDQYELFGWLLPIKPRPSVSNTFPNFLFPDLKFEANTNTHGEQRAFVVTGQYEKMLPMDIYPQHLMKSIIVNDYERMEGLGIYELSEEDIALCEFACTSKQPLQEILRTGLEMMREQS